MTTNVWLVRTPELDQVKFFDVFDLLSSIKGAYLFHTKEKRNPDQEEEAPQDPEIQHVGQVSKPWEFFFGIAEAFRKEHDQVGNNDYVVVLSDFKNHDNWFSGADYGGAKNLFVHCEDWDYFSRGSDVRYPIAYHVAITLLHHTWFKNTRELGAKVHDPNPEGCINDLCQNKMQVHLKMRTGDICDACCQDLMDEKVDSNLVKHVLDIIGKVSSLMKFSTKWKFESKLPVLSIVGKERNFVFEELGNLRISHGTGEQARALYCLILDNHRDETFLYREDLLNQSQIQQDLIDYYFEASGYLSKEKDKNQDIYQRKEAKIKARLTNENSVPEWVSALKKGFISALGEELAAYYYPMQLEYKKGSQEKSKKSKTNPYFIGKNMGDTELEHIVYKKETEADKQKREQAEKGWKKVKRI